MNTAIEVREEVGLPVSVDTAKLIRSGVSNNTLKAYRHALAKLQSWMHNRGTRRTRRDCKVQI